jgi:hypothetical protein
MDDNEESLGFPAVVQDDAVSWLCFDMWIGERLPFSDDTIVGDGPILYVSQDFVFKAPVSSADWLGGD